MTLSILRPVAITDAVLISSNVAEDSSPAWSAATSWPLDAVVHDPATHRRYQSLTAGNFNNAPASSPASWVDIGPTNRWAMFDGASSPATEQAGSIEVRLRPGPVSAAAVLGAQVAVMKVEMLDSPGGARVLYREISLRAGSASDWYEWTTSPYEFRSQVVVGNLPLYPDPELRITLVAAGSDPARCSEVLPGVVTEVGEARFGVSLGIVDYSRKETDDFGATTLVKRANVKKLRVPLRLDAQRLAKTYELLAAVQATPIVVVTDEAEDYDALTAFGFVSDFSIDVALPHTHYCTLELTGLT